MIYFYFVSIEMHVFMSFSPGVHTIYNFNLNFIWPRDLILLIGSVQRNRFCTVFTNAHMRSLHLYIHAQLGTCAHDYKHLASSPSLEK